MRGDFRLGLAARALLIGSVISVPPTAAQSGMSKAEMKAILGEPKEAGAGLDPNVIRVLGEPEGVRPGEAALSVQSAEIASKLRCPVCQGVSIADSPSGLASQMRGQVRALVEKGYSENQVISYFEHSYGEFVRLEPPLRGLNWMLWLLPAAALLGGCLFVLSRARTPVATPARDAQAPPTPDVVDPTVAKYLDRIRRDSGISS